jgi:hypothetical protein
MKERQIKKILSAKQEAVKDTRVMKVQLRNDVIKMKEDDVRRKQLRHEELKRQEIETRERKEQKKREQEKKIKEHFELKARMEEAEVRRAELLVRALEQKEREWIERLRDTQTDQERTYIELESTLQQGPGSPPGSKKAGASTDSRERPSTDPQHGSAEAFPAGRGSREEGGARAKRTSSGNGGQKKASTNKHH